MRDDRLRLLDILDAIERIEAQAARGKEAILRDEFLQVWMIHHLQIVGEASAGLSQELRAQYPQAPWSEAISMRNVLVHEYFGIDLEVIWDTVSRNLPKLKQEVERILCEMDKPGS
ncbi:MAG: DUF86 domain-containing protein [Candidatus Tectomicrobia bacterium]|nr:DUF86 domain-containing protein [Candidatus Tectomicrobia bacterium]